MSEKYIYTWRINVITNKNNKRKIIISQTAPNVDIAKTNLFSDYLKLSRYGIPCYVIDNINRKHKLTYIDSKNMFSEYFEITTEITNTISSIIPEITIPKKLNYINTVLSEQQRQQQLQQLQQQQNAKILNVNAKPFVPYSTY